MRHSSLGAWGIQTRPFAALKANFALKSFQLWTFLLSPFPLFPRKMRKWNCPNLSETQESQCLGHLTWIICSHLSQFCFEIFPTFDFHDGGALSTWGEPISFIPQEMRKWNSPNFSDTQEHSTWIICSPLSQFCSKIFLIFNFHAGGAHLPTHSS